MKNRKAAVFTGIITGITVIVLALFSVSAYDGQDPLITLSYLEEVVLPSIKAEILEAVSGIANNDSIAAENNAGEKEIISESDSSKNSDEETSDSTSHTGTYTLIELSKGETVMADSICEFIIRPGSRVSVISPFDAQGAADITNGIEILNGEIISINAYCLIPRGNDGRGLKVESDKAYIMIRGEYTIV